MIKMLALAIWASIAALLASSAGAHWQASRAKIAAGGQCGAKL